MWHIQPPEMCVSDWWHLPVHFTDPEWVSGPWSRWPKGSQWDGGGWDRVALGKENEQLLLIHKDPEISSIGQSMVPVTPR